MKFAVAKRYLLSASVFMLVAVIMSPSASADSYPYLKEFGGDVWAGGWFKDATKGTCATYDATTNPNYQNPSNPSPAPAQDNGGILTYANTNGGGSSTEFGAFALGLIDTSGPNGGFYSDAKTATSASTKLSFATPGNADGGLFEGAQQQAHCIPDYYDSKQVSPTALPPSGGIDVSTLSNQQYSISVPAGSAISISGAVKNGQRTTIFVKGDVYINANLTYAAGYNESSVPKFALVVKGNIFVDSGVTQMDGLYISQPDTTNQNTIDSSGVIWTCYDTVTPSASNSKDGTWIFGNCNNPLTVNGAFIAKHVNFARINSNVIAPTCGPQEPKGGNTAETINYSPEMVIGGPFFNPPASSSTLKINALVSLPPLY